jgi:hypothetical protein
VVVSEISCDTRVETDDVVTVGGGRDEIGKTRVDDDESVTGKDDKPAEEGGVANGRAGM